MEEPRVAIIKVPEGFQDPSMSKFAEKLGNAIGGKVFILPMDFEVLVGKAGAVELKRFHRQIHMALGLNIDEFFYDMPLRTLKFPQRLWFKFQWYKHIRRRNIVGFYSGTPIVKTDNLENSKYP